ncbi:MAG: hypothetical protein ACT4ON_10455 [Bacteroidota bacterium]
MKKALLILLVNASIVSDIFAQAIYTNKNDVFAAKSFNFYGYDHTKLRIADATRMGQNIMPFFPALSKLLLAEFNQKKFEIMFRKGKGNIPFYPIPTESLNAKINNGKVVTIQPQKISVDSLSAMIKKYELPEKEGIGSVIIFECFNREEKTETAYMVFFDIATRNILYSKDIESRDGNGYNYMGDWKKAALKTIPRLLDLCVADFNLYRKQQKEANKTSEK